MSAGCARHPWSRFPTRTWSGDSWLVAPRLVRLSRLSSDRHGPLVLQTCRSALGGDHHTADDSFQAVFLVLVRKARTLRLTEPLGPWLFEVARRICLQAKASKVRRVRHEALAAKGEGVTSIEAPDEDLAAVVHAEVGRLPRLLRTAVVLCDLAGLSYDEAANRLGVTHSTVRGRLARGRERLRKRLELRGLTPNGIWSAVAVVPVSLASATVEAAEVMTGRSVGMVSTGILELVNGGLHTMVFTKLKAAGLSALAGSVLIAGALGLSAQTAPTTTPAQAPSSYDAAVELVATLTEDADPSDDVAALVRKAQRQQDRGDAAAARKTLSQVENALRRWAKKLDQPTATLQLDTRVTPGGDAAGTFRGTIQKSAAASGVDSAAAPTSPYLRLTKPADVEKRLEDLEKKFDRLLKQLEAKNKGPEQ